MQRVTIILTGDFQFLQPVQRRVLGVDDEEGFGCLQTNTTEGSMSVGELVIPGESNKNSLFLHIFVIRQWQRQFEILFDSFFAAHILKLNQNILMIFWCQKLLLRNYLSHNEKVMKGIDCGMVITTCGCYSDFSVKKSWNDRHFSYSFRCAPRKWYSTRCVYFDIRGSDERQYSSQGFRINTRFYAKVNFMNMRNIHNSIAKLYYHVI